MRASQHNANGAGSGADTRRGDPGLAARIGPKTRRGSIVLNARDSARATLERGLEHLAGWVAQARAMHPDWRAPEVRTAVLLTWAAMAGVVAWEDWMVDAVEHEVRACGC